MSIFGFNFSSISQLMGIITQGPSKIKEIAKAYTPQLAAQLHAYFRPHVELRENESTYCVALAMVEKEGKQTVIVFAVIGNDETGEMRKGATFYLDDLIDQVPDEVLNIKMLGQ